MGTGPAALFQNDHAAIINLDLALGFARRPADGDTATNRSRHRVLLKYIHRISTLLESSHSIGIIGTDRTNGISLKSKI